MARQMVRLGRLQVATPETMAMAVRNPTPAQDAVDERVDGPARAAAKDELTNNPAVVDQAAAKAAQLAQSDAGLLRKTDPQAPQLNDGPGILASIVDSTGARTWLEANDQDGGPTDHVLDLVKVPFGLPDRYDVPGTSVVVTDAAGYRTWLEANDRDGGPSDAATAFIRSALDGTSTPATIVCDGDSMTELANGGGAGPWPSLLATNTGRTVINLGRSGAWAAEVVSRAGGIVPLITLPSNPGQLPADTTPTAVTVDSYGGWSNMSDLTRGVFGTIRGIRFRLTYETTNGFMLTRVVAGAAVKVASPVSFVPETPYLGPGFVHTLWVGRNNVSNGTDAYTPISRQVDEFRRSGVKFLLFSVCNTSPFGATTGEPQGSTNYNAIVALNGQLQKLAPREYVDVRGRLIREGLALAGLTPTADDTADIAADMIPRALLSDGLHTNGPGRVAVEAIVRDELTIRHLI